MATSTKRRVTKIGPKHRLSITIEQTTLEALQGSGEREGFSISALASRVIIRGVAAGLIDDDTTPYQALLQQYIDQQDTWLARVELADEKNDELLAALHNQTEVIVKLSKELKKYEQDRLEAESTVEGVQDGNEAVQTKAPD